MAGHPGRQSSRRPRISAFGKLAGKSQDLRNLTGIMLAVSVYCECMGEPDLRRGGEAGLEGSGFAAVDNMGELSEGAEFGQDFWSVVGGTIVDDNRR